MLSEMIIKKFRGIEDLKLENLGTINIIAGENNVGKTSILEVIESLEAPNDIRNWRLVGRREGNSFRAVTTVYETMKYLFPVKVGMEQTKIEYEGKYNGKEFSVELFEETYETTLSARAARELSGYSTALEIDEAGEANEYETDVMEIKYRINGKNAGSDTIYSIQRGVSGKRNHYADKNKIVDKVVSVSPTDHTQNMVYLKSLLKEPELYEQFVEVMRQFDPYFVSINAVNDRETIGTKYMVLSKNHTEDLLLNAYGDGMKKAILLLSAVILAKGGILLLDEFETAIHVSVMEKVFRWILETARKLDVQIFMTSHSLEAISAVLKCCPELQKDMRMITLVKVDDKIKVRNVDGEKAVTLLDEYGLELR